VTERPRWIAVGRITRAHGVKGEVAVLLLSEVESRFEHGSQLHLDGSDERPLTVVASRSHGGRVLVRFDEVADRTAAEALAGRYLLVPAESAPDPPQGAYWAHQLVGCRVRTEAGRQLGEITEVVHSPANDVWVAAMGSEEVLIPALRTVVVSVDVEGGMVVVRDVEGLTGP
jgi:16S rRNA processing protein RimM